MTRRASVFVLVGLVTACGGSSIRGGAVAAPERQPGSVVARYRPVSCRDGSGAPAALPPLTVLLTREAGPPVLIEQRPGYPPLLFTNYFEDGSELVFQVELSGGGGDLVREYRVARGAQSAKLSVIDAWRERELPHGRFRIVPGSLALSCSLDSGRTAPGGSTSS
jgi:hypothetical protein